MTDIYTSTCLGCKHLNQDFEEDWSEYTPGAGYYCNCSKSHFYELEASETYKLIGYAQGCPDFELSDYVKDNIENMLKERK